MASKACDEASQHGTGLSFTLTHSKKITAKWSDGQLIKPPRGQFPPSPSPTDITTPRTIKSITRYRLILTKASTLDWLTRDRHAMQNLSAIARAGTCHWVPIQDLPFDEIILFAYAADHSSRPTYVCPPSGLYHARSGRILRQSGSNDEVVPLPGIYFFDG